MVISKSLKKDNKSLMEKLENTPSSGKSLASEEKDEI